MLLRMVVSNTSTMHHVMQLAPPEAEAFLLAGRTAVARVMVKTWDPASCLAKSFWETYQVRMYRNA